MKNFIYILLIAPLFIISSCEEEAIHGCLDSQALNYNPEASLDNNSCEYIELGVLAEGGIVFYIDGTGEHGLVAAMEDLGEFEWGCYLTESNGADGLAIGTGYQNTLDIVAGCSETPIAASEALAYESGGYSDWYLPSIEELELMYNTIGQGADNYGGFSNGWYWSSSENFSNNAWLVNFGNGYATYTNKDYTGRVRVIRAF
tara:strand:+ start:27 stop:632 length:606 start_codon:yes stop_codon:yes gene_type:complete